MTSSIIRKYLPSDMESCIELFDLNCPEFFAESEKKDYIKFLSTSSHQYELLLMKNKLVAAFGLSPNENATYGRLTWIIVSPLTQRCGIGAIIMNHILTKAENFNLPVIYIAASHLSAPFFAKFGAIVVNFTQHGWGLNMHRIDMELHCFSYEERLKQVAET